LKILDAATQSEVKLVEVNDSRKALACPLPGAGFREQIVILREQRAPKLRRAVEQGGIFEFRASIILRR
jgi:hypothetical protein